MCDDDVWCKMREFEKYTKYKSEKPSERWVQFFYDVKEHVLTVPYSQSWVSPGILLSSIFPVSTSFP